MMLVVVNLLFCLFSISKAADDGSIALKKEKFPIYVKVEGGPFVGIDVPIDGTVQDIIRQCPDAPRWPLVMFSGSELKNDALLSDEGIAAESEIKIEFDVQKHQSVFEPLFALLCDPTGADARNAFGFKSYQDMRDNAARMISGIDVDEEGEITAICTRRFRLTWAMVWRHIESMLKLRTIQVECTTGLSIALRCQLIKEFKKRGGAWSWKIIAV